ncbi:MAG: GNAT family N-acetyltransferase [Candidatus Paceibacterota bacterium]
MIKIVSGNLAYLPQYTSLLQKTYEQAYVDESLGLTKECFSKEIFSNQETQDYLSSHLIDNDEQKTWLALEKNKLVGAITCIIKSDSEAELTGFYVDPKFQGKSVGKQLYKLACDFSGQRDLVLDIYAHNTKTIEMYQKWGWKLDKTRGKQGYFFRHWPEWPEGLEAKAMYLRLKRG